MALGKIGRASLMLVLLLLYSSSSSRYYSFIWRAIELSVLLLILILTVVELERAVSFDAGFNCAGGD